MKTNWRTLLGELVMIVAGILIALGLDDWSQDRRDRRAELQLLRQMHAALTADLEDNRTDYEFFRDERARVAGIARVLSEARAYSPEQDTLFGALLGTRTLQVNTGPYDVLRARGFELLSDDSLRSQIVLYYGTTVPYLATRYERVDHFVDSYAAPYYFEHFVNGSRGGGRARPISFDFVRGDPAFRNMVTWELEELEHVTSSYADALEDGDDLVNAIDAHVHQLE